MTQVGGAGEACLQLWRWDLMNHESSMSWPARWKVRLTMIAKKIIAHAFKQLFL